MKILHQLQTLAFIILCILVSCKSSSDKNNNPVPAKSLADTLSADTSFCYRCLRSNKTKADSLACVQYCPKIKQPTGTNIYNGTDYGYFDLTLDGVDYHFSGIPENHSPVGSDGNIHFGSFFLLNGQIILTGIARRPTPNAINSFTFSASIAWTSGPGTLSFKFLDSESMNIVGVQLNPTMEQFMNCQESATCLVIVNNVQRTRNGTDCDETDLPLPTQTITITKWGNVGEMIEGNITGTFLEDFKTSLVCKSSKPYPYSGTFKIRRGF